MIRGHVCIVFMGQWEWKGDKGLNKLIMLALATKNTENRRLTATPSVQGTRQISTGWSKKRNPGFNFAITSVHRF